MQPGDIVKKKGEEEYARVAYSTFGISLHLWNSKRNALVKTLGDSPSTYQAYWDVIEELPEGWVSGPYGCPVQKPEVSKMDKKEYEIMYAEMSAFDNQLFEGFRVSWGAKEIGFGQLDFYYEKEGEEKDEFGEPINRKLKCDNEFMSKEFVQAVLMKLVDEAEFQDVSK